MPRPRTDALSSIFFALAHARRRQLLSLVRASHGMTVAQLVAATTIDQPTVSRHLDLLRRGQLVSRVSRGRYTVNFIEQAGQFQADAWFASLFDGRDGLDDQHLSEAQLNRVFSVPAAPCGRSLLEAFAWRGEVTVGALQAHLGVDQPEMSRRLRFMTNAGLIRVRPSGAKRLCVVDPLPLWSAWGWLVNPGSGVPSGH